MADERPLLNPVLRLKMEAVPEPQTGGGKGRASVVKERLPVQQQVLGAATEALYRERASLAVYGGRTHLLARMFAHDSLAPSHSPHDLFSRATGCQLVAPYRHGYVVEADVESLPRLLAAIRHPASFAVQSDISRVESVGAFLADDRLHHRSAEQLWDAANEDDEGRLFVVWLAPFHRNHVARACDLREVKKPMVVPRRASPGDQRNKQRRKQRPPGRLRPQISRCCVLSGFARRIEHDKMDKAFRP